MNLPPERLPLDVPRSSQRGLFERFLIGDIEITSKPVSVAKCCLDRRGEDRFRKCQETMPIETLIGLARLKWKSPSCCKKCRLDQKRRTTGSGNRWKDIKGLTKAINRSDKLPLAAVVYPGIIHEGDGLLVIDGGRRIVAHVVAGADQFELLVVRPQTNRRNKIQT
ncbi:MAG: hypothetical protein R6U98_29390 [Pirellulaceae bacterium]